MREEQLEGVGGLEIFTRSWRRESRRARGVVVLVHGFNYMGVAAKWSDPSRRSKVICFLSGVSVSSAI